MLLDRMPESKMNTDLVSIPTTVASPYDISRIFQVGDDPLDSAFGDAYEVGNIPHPCLGVPGNAK